ncbi:hypothetical protein G7Y89_g9140 [Cudoniella acicularis]|uniref:BTB domain-containing protein n=1 Tax=Cudoniella acicularis TaxID=354080 RepID=A0A8H4W269_9HELO|nr:hypothetical protein G7Y89_g9140 [Cudoniella acicularis]
MPTATATGTPSSPSTKISFAEDLGTEVVSIYVGPERKHFVVHKSLLTTQSTYFDRALNGNFKEAEENSIYMEEEDPAAVGLLVGWLYRGAIPGAGGKMSPFARRSSDDIQSFVSPPPFPETGTTSPYVPGQYPDFNNPRNTEHFLHIAFDPQYQQFSQEELRLSDYRSNRRYQTVPTTLPGPGPGIGGFAPLQQTAAAPATTTPMALTTGQAGGFAPYQSLFSNLPPRVNGLFSQPATNYSNPFSFVNRGPFTKKPTLQPGDFGYDSLISYPKSDGVFLNGIPRSEPLDSRQQQEDSQQLALLNLCILAETICWAKLFNDSVNAYVSGEANMHRNIPIVHVEIIYQRTHSDSTLREFVIDSIRRLRASNGEAHMAYMSLAQQYEEFLENILGHISGLKFVDKRASFGDPQLQKTYHMPEEDPLSNGLRGGVFARKEKEEKEDEFGCAG